MALLLAMYQKMRLIREKNRLALDLTKITSRKKRVESNIAKTQKYYTSLTASIEKQATMLKAQGKIQFQNAMGLGTMNNNPFNLNGLSGFVMNCMSSLCSQGYKNESQKINLPGMDSSKFQAMLQEYQTNGGRFLPELNSDNTQKYVEETIGGQKTSVPKYKNYTYQEVQLFMQAMQTAQNQQQMAQWQCQQMSTNYDSNVSIWEEARKAEIDAQQEMALSPLNYEDTQLDLDKAYIEQRLEEIKAELQSYNSLCKDEASESAPKFGLG